jgi:hypothetical protein
VKELIDTTVVVPRRSRVRRHTALGTLALAALVVTTVPAGATSTLASGAARLEVRLDRGLNATAHRYANAATSNRATIAAIIAKVNALPATSPYPMGCPADFGATLTLRFFQPGATRAYAIVVTETGGCGLVTVTYLNANASATSSTHRMGGAAFSLFVAKKLGLSDLEVT